MIPTLGIVALQFALLTAAGWSALSLLPQRTRDQWAPATPLVGAAFLVVVLSSTIQVMSAQRGMLVVGALALVLVGIAVKLGRRPWLIGRRALATSAVVLLASLGGTAVALLPTHYVGDNMAAPSGGSLDLFYYASESAWLRDHPVEPGPTIGDVPGSGNATPGYASMEGSLSLSLRYGQPLVAAGLDGVMGTESIQTMSPIGVLWILLTGPAAFVALRLLRVHLAVALGCAVLFNCSALIGSLLFAENVDSLLGVSFAVLTIGSGVSFIRGTGAWWPSALALCGLVAVYPEYALYVAPAVVGSALVADRADLLQRLRRGVVLGLGAALIAPMAWKQGIGTVLIERGDTGADWGSPFYSDGVATGVARFLGLTSLDDPSGPLLLTVIVAIGYVVGAVAAVVHRPERWSWVALLAVAGLYLGKLSIDEAGYMQYRATQLFAPIALLVAALGWGELLRGLRRSLRQRRSDHRRVDRLLGAGALAAVVAVAGVNLHSAAANANPGLTKARHVDGTYWQAADWVERYGAADGSDVSVLSPDITNHVWLAYLLKDKPLVSYPAIRSDYLLRLSYWDQQVDPLALLGPGAFSAGPRSDVLESNRRFKLLRLSERSVLVTPVELMTWSAFARPRGALDGPDLAKLMVLRVPAGPDTVRLRFRAPAMAGDPVAITHEGATLATATISRQVTEVDVPLPPGDATTLQIDLGADGVLAKPTLLLTGVRVVQ